MFKKLFVFAAVIAVIIAAYLTVKPREGRQAPAGPTISEEKPVKLASPLGEISLPVIIKGEARGYWFFEAQFPVKIISESGSIIGTGLAAADGEWMTEDFVPFTAKIKGGVSEPTKAQIIFEKDNPSGAPEFADLVSFPVTVIPQTETLRDEPEDTISIRAYFGTEGEDDCSKVQYVERVIPRTQEVGKAAILELLKGPGNDDPKLFTSINPETKLNKITIKNGVAYADFNSGLNKNIGGSCRVAAIRAQITETLKQFPTVKDVVISVNGKTEAILEP